MEIEFVMPPNKPHFANVSLICIETRYPQLAQYAIDRCLAMASFNECILLCEKTHALPSYITQIVIPPIPNIDAYSSFMLRDLGKYFSSDFVLIVQWDSFILNGHVWTDDFFQYDYIGAPWPHRPVAVGNGGFSLRSRRLINTLKKIELKCVHPEDYVICELHHDELVHKHGIKFAPEKIAAHFAFECIEPSGPTFGFHGFFNFHHALNDTELCHYIKLCDQSTMQSPPALRLLKNLYRSGRHAMAKKVLARYLRLTPAGILEAASLYLRIHRHALRHYFKKMQSVSTA